MRKKEAAEEFAAQLSEALTKAREHFEEEKRVLRDQLTDVHKKELEAAKALPTVTIKVNILRFLIFVIKIGSSLFVCMSDPRLPIARILVINIGTLATGY